MERVYAFLDVTGNHEQFTDQMLRVGFSVAR